MQQLENNGISCGLHIWYRILLTILGSLLATIGVLEAPRVLDNLPPIVSFEMVTIIVGFGLTLITGPIIIIIGLFAKKSTVIRTVNRIFMKKSDFK